MQQQRELVAGDAADHVALAQQRGDAVRNLRDDGVGDVEAEGVVDDGELVDGDNQDRAASALGAGAGDAGVDLRRHRAAAQGAGELVEVGGNGFRRHALVVAYQAHRPVNAVDGSVGVAQKPAALGQADDALAAVDSHVADGETVLETRIGRGHGLGRADDDALALLAGVVFQERLVVLAVFRQFEAYGAEYVGGIGAPADAVIGGGPVKQCRADVAQDFAQPVPGGIACRCRLCRLLMLVQLAEPPFGGHRSCSIRDACAPERIRKPQFKLFR